MLLLPAQGSIVVVGNTGITGLSLCGAFVGWVGVATLVAVGEIVRASGMYGRY